jgi:uncharacterized membrane protein YeiB
MKNRIIGIDVARALAIIGMILVNFKIAFGDSGQKWLESIIKIFEGKAAATFVVLAGIGISFMSKSALKSKDSKKILKVKKSLTKRALVLFVVGLSYVSVWSADILHFYGIYMLLTLFLLEKSQKIIFITTLTIVFIYPFLMITWNYDLGWNYILFTYSDFWSVNGFIRNLFYNGFHPVLPWISFMLIGLWFGRQNLNDITFVKKALIISLSLFIFIQVLSFALITIFSGSYFITNEELHQIFGTNPMPPLPLYIMSGSSIAISIISACILFAKKYKTNKIINALKDMGQLALSFYVAHVVIGMGIIVDLNPNNIGEYSLEFSVIYALLFSLVCIIFAVIWLRFKKQGPLEWLLRKVTN